MLVISPGLFSVLGLYANVIIPCIFYVTALAYIMLFIHIDTYSCGLLHDCRLLLCDNTKICFHSTNGGHLGIFILLIIIRDTARNILVFAF